MSKHKYFFSERDSSGIKFSKNNRGKSKSGVFFLIFGIGILSLIMVGSIYFEGFMEQEEPNPSKPFVIDDLGLDGYTWSEIKALGWCTGNGLENDPYILDGLIINGSYSDNSLIIKNSVKYFILQNCKFNMSIYEWYAGGLGLYNVTNGKILNNKIYNNQGYGILVDNCQNLTIAENWIYNSTFTGLAIQFCHNIRIFNNNIMFSETWYGIRVSESDLINITNNEISEAGWAGLEVHSSNDSYIVENTIFNNYGYGLNSYICQNIDIRGNLFNGNDEEGIYLDSFNNSVIEDNRLFNNGGPHGGLYIQNSEKVIVYNNTSEENKEGYGMQVRDLFHSTITRNNLKNNFNTGIDMQDSSYLNVSENTAVENGNGIALMNGQYLRVFNNTVSTCMAGMAVIVSSNNLIYDNIVDNNSLAGIAVISLGFAPSQYNNFYNNTIKNSFYGFFMSDYPQFHPDTLGGYRNNVSANSIFNNEYGFVLGESEQNLIEKNIIKNNSLVGFVINTSSEQNIIKENVIDNNTIGLSIESGSYNYIYMNYFTNNKYHAIDKFIYNEWDNGSIGNYWDNYTGTDMDDNGIGDTPFSIPLMEQDNYPIWDDGADIPQPFTLFEFAADPDLDGEFDLSWTESQNALYYDLYYYDSIITEINESLSILTMGVQSLGYHVSDFDNGEFYIIAIAYNEYGYNATSNCVKVTITRPPNEFILSSDARSPDTDGKFHLTWTESKSAVNYTIYRWDGIVMGPPDQIIEGLTNLSYYFEFEVDDSYYFKIVAYNEYGETVSNTLRINVIIGIETPEGPLEEGLFQKYPWLFWVLIIGGIGGGAAVVGVIYVIMKRKKPRKETHIIKFDI